MKAHSMATWPAVFLDRDGVLNVDRGYVASTERFEWIAGARSAVRLFNALGFRTVLVTNQSGVARGMFDEADVHALHAWMQAELRSAGAFLDAIYHCPHLPEGTVDTYAVACECRKPKPGMLQRAVLELDLDPERSLLIGDSLRDLEAARAAGVDGYLFPGGNLQAFCRHILQERLR